MSKTRLRLRKRLLSRASLRAIISLTVFVLLWEIGARSKQWLGVSLPWIGQVPAPSAVLRVWAGLLDDRGYWQSWYLSLFRVLAGFTAAMVVGIPLGLLMAVSKKFNGLSFPVFELLRPVPPLAWVPISIIFWPTQELSIAFVTFLGAFFTVVITFIFHPLSDPSQMQAFFKNIAVVGGLLTVAAWGAGGWSVDAKRGH